MSALGISDLRVDIGATTPVEQVSLEVDAGSIHCLLGASGSGKTLTSLATIGLLPATATASGSIRLDGVPRDLLDLDEAAWSSVRGARIGHVGQNALGCLHPAFRVGWQLAEAIRRHQRVSRRDANERVLAELSAVDLRDVERVAQARPAELSGGMCQRVALAIALCNQPSVLVADEPTTALDHETQDRVLALIRRRADHDGLGVLMITHDQSVVEQVADRVTTIADGRSGPTVAGAEVVSPIRVVAERRSTTDPAAADVAPALQITGVGKEFGRSRRGRAAHRVLSDVDITAAAGTTVGLVGRSGSGKSTLAKIVVGVLDPTEGAVHIDGQLMTGPGRAGRLERAALAQYVFQDPFGSLNPRRSVREQVAEPLVASGVERTDAGDRATQMLADVGLTAAQIERPPTTLSGGQCQRVGVARALIRRPKVVVLDEPTSALDWDIREGILELLDDLQHEIGATYLLISHERPLIERMSDVIHRISEGRVAEDTSERGRRSFLAP